MGNFTSGRRPLGSSSSVLKVPIVMYRGIFTQNVLPASHLPLSISLKTTKELLHFIGTKEFVNECGGLFLILSKINIQRILPGGEKI